jgi:hypothetical protein
LQKAGFLEKTTQGKVYLEFVKGIREHLANSFDHGATTNSFHHNPLISDHPLDPEEVI